MNLYHLRYFVTLAHLEHYTKAAEQLSITQPSLSHAIADLEKELKVQLFEKQGRNVVLTKCGKSFLKDVEQALSILDFSVSNLQMTGSSEGVMDIAFLRVLGIHFIPAMLKDFKKLNPDLKISFRLHNAGGLSSGIIQGVKDRKFDVAFCSKYDDDPLLDFVPVASQDLVLIVPEGHPLACQDTVHLKETLNYPHIAFRKTSGLRNSIDRLFNQIGAYPEIVMEIEEDMVIGGLVAEGFGIAIVPKMYILGALNVKPLAITEPEPERYFYMVSLKGAYTAPAVERFKQFVSGDFRLKDGNLYSLVKS